MLLRRNLKPYACCGEYSIILCHMYTVVCALYKSAMCVYLEDQAYGYKLHVHVHVEYTATLRHGRRKITIHMDPSIWYNRLVN